MILRNNRGIALVMVLMVIAVLLGISAASLLFSGLNLKEASNLQTGSGALQAADAGIQHALAVIPAGTTFTYGSAATVVSTTVFPTASSGYSYVVTATNNPSTSPSTSTAILTSTANGPNNSTRVIRGYIGRLNSSWAPPGAIYIPGPANNPDFQIHGTTIITGNDYNVDGTSGPSAAIPGIATNSDATSQQVRNSITTPSNVTGAGYSAGPPVTPSVATTTSPLDINALANSFLALPHSTDCTAATLGTWAAPQITYCSTTEYEGNVSGVGVLIVDGSLHIEDNFNFKGIIIVRGGEVHIELSSTIATNIYGAILISPASPEIEIEGGGAIRYSSQALNKVAATWPNVLPTKAKLIAWNEVMQ
jgi:hypothetical protein